MKTEGTHFSVNGNPLFVNGFNSYWLMSLATDTAQRNKVTYVFNMGISLYLGVFNIGSSLSTFPISIIEELSSRGKE